MKMSFNISKSPSHTNVLKRLKKERKDIEKANDDEEMGFDAAPADENNYFEWNAHIQGPKGTPYESGLFFLNVVFPKEYPFKPPKISFETKIYHMNINDKGEICLRMLKDDWSPAYDLQKVLKKLVDMLITPNQEEPLVTEIAHLYVSNQKEHDKKAAEFTQKFAQ